MTTKPSPYLLRLLSAKTAQKFAAQGLKIPEIAKQMGVSEGTARKYVMNNQSGAMLNQLIQGELTRLNSQTSFVISPKPTPLGKR